MPLPPSIPARRDNCDVFRTGYRSRLVRNDPQSFLCNICKQLHPRNSVVWPNRMHLNKGKGQPCPEKPWQFYPNNNNLRQLLQKNGSRYRLNFTHVQLACEGGLPLEAFRHLELCTPKYYNPGAILSTDARVVGGELLLRSQLWIVVSSLQRNEIITQGLFGNICRHMESTPEELKLLEERLNKLLKCRVNHLDRRSKLDKCGFCTKLIQCKIFYMEFKIDAKVLEDREADWACLETTPTTSGDPMEVDSVWGSSRDEQDEGPGEYSEEPQHFTAIYITRYLNLGAGLDWSNEKWMGHLVDNDAVERSYQPDFIEGSIQTDFENAEDSSLEEFTACNERRLLAFQQAYTGFGPPHCIPAEEEGYYWMVSGGGDRCWVLTRNEMPVVGPLN